MTPTTRRRLQLTCLGTLALGLGLTDWGFAQASSSEDVRVVLSTSHSGKTVGLGFSSDGRYLASFGSDGSVIQWDLATYLGAWRKQLPGDGTALAVSPLDDSVFAASIGHAGRWAMTGEPLSAPVLYAASLYGEAEQLWAAEFTADGSHLAGFGWIDPGAPSGLLQLWETAHFERVQADRLSVPTPHYSAFGIDSVRGVLYYGADRGIEAWPLPGHEGDVHGVEIGKYGSDALAISADGKFLVTGGDPARVYALPDLRQHSTLPQSGSSGRSMGIAHTPHFSADSKRLAAGIRLLDDEDGDQEYSGGVAVWEHKSGTEFSLLEKWKAHSDHTLAVRLHPSGELCVTANSDGTFEMWKVDDGSLVRRWGSPTSAAWHLASDPLRPGVFCGLGPRVRRLDLVNGTLEEAEPHVGSDLISSVAVSPDGSLIAGSTKDRELVVYHRHGQRVVFRTTGQEGHYSKILFLDDRRIAAINFDTLGVWDIETGEQVLRRKAYLRDIALDADRSLLALGDGNLLDTESLQQVRLNVVPARGYINALAVSPSGAVAYGGTGDCLLVPGEGKQPIELKGHAGWMHALEFSPDGKVLASGGADGAVYLRDASTGEINHRVALNSTIRSFAVTSDGARLVVGTDSGRLWLLDMATGEELVQVAPGSDGDFATFAPGGFYRASRGMLANVGFSRDGKTYLCEQFDLHYNRPDYIIERLGQASSSVVTGYRRAREKRMEKMGLKAGGLLEGAKLPTASFLKTLPSVSESRELSLHLGALDAGFALHSLHLSINGIPLHGEHGIPISTAAGTPYKGEHKIELSDGRNIVQVAVRNARGVDSLRQTAEVRYTGPRAKRSLLALVVGVSDYDKDAYDLEYAAKDARDMARALEQAGEAFDHVEVRGLYDHDVNSASLAAAREMFASGRPDDLAVVFVAGHGLLDSDLNYYLASSAVDFADPASAGIPYELLEGLLTEIPPRKKLLLMDTCFSGEVDENSPGLDAGGAPFDQVSARGITVTKSEQAPLVSTDAFALMRDLFADLRRGSGAVVISSAGGQEFAFESEQWNNGAFTYAVLEALDRRLADSDGDHVVSVRELRAYVGARVQELTGGRQHPTTRQDNISSDFPLY